MLAIYTCFFGSDTNWTNVILDPIDGVDCYYFTNNPNTFHRLQSTRWKPVWVNLPVSSDNLVSAEQTKRLRCCPWEYEQLKPYPYICWVDSKLRITHPERIHQIVSELEVSDAVWAFTLHPIKYTNVWGEFHEAMKHEKYARQRDQNIAYIQSRLALGFDAMKPQRTCCGFNIRKQCPLAKEMGELWLSEIQECGIEDQISFQFVHQKYEDKILLFPYQFCWTYC
jgi:hypothetical protein